MVKILLADEKSVDLSESRFETLKNHSQTLRILLEDTGMDDPEEIPLVNIREDEFAAYMELIEDPTCVIPSVIDALNIYKVADSLMDLPSRSKALMTLNTVNNVQSGIGSGGPGASRTNGLGGAGGPQYPDEFRKIVADEQFIRLNYGREFGDDTRLDHNDTLYGLIELTDVDVLQMQKNWKKFTESEYLTNDAVLAKESLGIVKSPHKYERDLSVLIPDDFQDDLVVAGGSVTSTLVRTNDDVDFDIFIVKPEGQEKILESYIRYLDNTYGMVIGLRSINAVTLYCYDPYKISVGEYLKIQVILRQYNSVSQVLYGFDIDACCAAYYKGKFYVNPRARYALEHRVNTVNMEHYSPSYDCRLCKYAVNKGFKIFVPGFNRKNPKYHLGEKDVVMNQQCRGLLRLLNFEKSEMQSIETFFNKREKHDYETSQLDYIKDRLGIGEEGEDSGIPKVGVPKKKCMNYFNVYFSNSVDLLLEYTDTDLENSYFVGKQHRYPKKVAFLKPIINDNGAFEGAFRPQPMSWDNWFNSHVKVLPHIYYKYKRTKHTWVDWHGAEQTYYRTSRTPIAD